MELSQFLEKFADPASSLEIQSLEEKYKISVPEIVKQILFFSNGSPTIDRYIYVEKSMPEYTTGFFSVEGIDYGIQHILEIESDYHYYFSDVLLPIGDAGGSRLLCIGLNGEFKDRIYIIDYQSYDGEETKSMLFYVAASMDELFKNLRPTYEECE